MRDSCTWKIGRTKTFRLGSSKILGTYGGNIQNIEKGMREVYLSDGWTEKDVPKLLYYQTSGDLSIFSQEELDRIFVLVQTDEDGADARIVAYECEAKAYRQLFIHVIKSHVFVAMHLFHDVWQERMLKDNLTGGLSFNISDYLKCPIQALKALPHWQNLNHLIKESDDWPVSERYYYLAKQTCHCVDDKTEVLTKLGWANIANVASIGKLKTEIAIYDRAGKILFETPRVWNSMHITDTMYHFQGEEVDQFVTKYHNMVYESNNKLHKNLAQCAFKLNKLNAITSGEYVGGTENHPSWYVKLLVAIQADGYIQSCHIVRFRFKRQRKIERIESILKESGLTYTKKIGEVTEFLVKDIKHILDFFYPRKIWSAKLLKWSTDNLKTFIDELKHWDGTFTEEYLHKREEFISIYNDNAQWVKTICHLVNKQGTILHDGNVYRVGLNNRTHSIADKKKIITEYTGTVYCPTVSTGMFLIRRNGKISVTGNSANYDIQAATFRMNILEKSGGKILISQEEAVRFLEVYRNLFPEIPERNRRVAQQAEATGVLYNMFGHPYTITSYKSCWTENTRKEWYSWSPQSTVGMIINVAVPRFYDYARGNKLHWDILANGHDSMISQVPLGQVLEGAKKSKDCVEQEFESPVDSAKFTMKSETKVGFNWAPYNKTKNPLGLKEIKI